MNLFAYNTTTCKQIYVANVQNTVSWCTVTVTSYSAFGIFQCFTLHEK